MNLYIRCCAVAALFMFCLYCQAQESDSGIVLGVYGYDGQWELPIFEDDKVQIYQFGEEGLSNLMKHTKNKNVEIRVFQSIDPAIERLLNPDSDEEPRCPEEEEPIDNSNKMVVLGCNGGAPDTVSFVSEFLKKESHANRANAIRPNAKN